MKRIIHLSLLLLFLTNLYAQEQNSKTLEIKGTNSIHTFVLSEISNVKYLSDKMVLTFESRQQVSFDIAEIECMKFVKSESTGIATTNRTIMYDGKGFIFTGEGICHVSIYSTAGHILDKIECEAGKRIDLSHYAQSMLIINIEGTTYKIETR